MITILSGRPEEILRFRAGPWQFQQTFETPLKDLDRFVSTFLAPFSLRKGLLCSFEVVFEPEHLLEFMANEGIVPENCYELNVCAQGQHGVKALLEAALHDWVDFIFVPTPDSFAICADHDEFTTFYTNSRPVLKSLCSELKQAGFEAVPGYERPEELY